jgi:hypothetical protein
MRYLLFGVLVALGLTLVGGCSDRPTEGVHRKEVGRGGGGRMGRGAEGDSGAKPAKDKSKQGIKDGSLPDDR